MIKNNNLIDFSVRGNVDGSPTIVFIHGLGASSQQFCSIVDRLESEGALAKIILLNLPGHADSFAQSSDSISFSNFAQGIIDTCDALNIHSALFIGISMGSELSLLCAKLRRDLVAGVLAIRPAWFIDKAPEHLQIIDQIGSWLTENDESETILNLEKDEIYSTIAQDNPNAAASIMGAVTRTNAKQHAQVLRTIFADRPFGTTAELGAVKVPSRVLANYSDPLHPVSVAQLVANAVPNAKFEIIPPKYFEANAHDEAIVQHIQDFIETNWKEVA